jgi:hypothetical protein
MRSLNGFAYGLGVALLFMVLGCDEPQPVVPPKPLPPVPLPHFEDEPTGGDRIKTGDTATDRIVVTYPTQVTQYTPSAEAPPPKNGNFGYTPNKQKSKEFIQSLDKPTLFEANPDLKEDDDTKIIKEINLQGGQDIRGPPAGAKTPTLLYQALYVVSPGWQVGSQGIGDCVSWGTKHAVDIALAIDKVAGKASDWKPASSEAIYGGARVEGAGRAEGTGGWSDGSWGSAAASWIVQSKGRGGVVYRDTSFPGLSYPLDLSQYSATRAKQWGNYGCGGQGDNGRLDKIARERPVGQVALVRNFAEATAAIESGYPIFVCSGQGFSNVRDEKGFAKASGSWAHCMCFIGVRHDPPGLLCLNSWGTKWISGPKFPADQPDGSFWVTVPVSDRMLAGNDSYAVSHLKGFPKRRLRHDVGW